MIACASVSVFFFGVGLSLPWSVSKAKKSCEVSPFFTPDSLSSSAATCSNDIRGTISFDFSLPPGI